MNHLQTPDQSDITVPAEKDSSFEGTELLQVPTLPELTLRIRHCLQEDRLHQHDFDCLRKHLEFSYKRHLLDAFYSGHPSYCICTGAAATDIYLFRNWPVSKSDKRNKKSLQQIAEQIEENLLPEKGTQITPKTVHEILAFLEARYQFFSVSAKETLYLLFSLTVATKTIMGSAGHTSAKGTKLIVKFICFTHQNIINTRLSLSFFTNLAMFSILR